MLVLKIVQSVTQAHSLKNGNTQIHTYGLSFRRASSLGNLEFNFTNQDMFTGEVINNATYKNYR